MSDLIDWQAKAGKVDEAYTKAIKEARELEQLINESFDDCVKWLVTLNVRDQDNFLQVLRIIDPRIRKNGVLFRLCAVVDQNKRRL